MAFPPKKNQFKPGSDSDTDTASPDSDSDDESMSASGSESTESTDNALAAWAKKKRGEK